MAKVTAISSLGWAHYTLYQALPRMSRLGFERAEICSLGSYCFHFHHGSPTPPELKELFEDHGLTPVGLNYSVGMSHAWDPDHIDLFAKRWERKLVHLGEVGIPMMCMLFGIRNQRDDAEAQLASVVRFYDRVATFAEGLGVRMLLEVPHLYNILNRPDQVLWVLDRLKNSNIGVLIDSSHWGIIGYDIDEFFGALGDRLWHIHLRDSAGPDTADRLQDLEKTPGSGTVDFKKLAEALDNVNYSGDVTMELEYRDMTLDAIDQEYRKGLAYLKIAGWELPSGVVGMLESTA
ncbi:MAG: sugar phosphate isomerase/epimerase [Phycisphaerae bacterium]|nr:sugar phosphate isomerase/epimerase [Phycisphaerae bacterium]